MSKSDDQVLGLIALALRESLRKGAETMAAILDAGSIEEARAIYDARIPSGIPEIDEAVKGGLKPDRIGVVYPPVPAGITGRLVPVLPGKHVTRRRSRRSGLRRWWSALRDSAN